MTNQNFQNVAYECLINLATEEGINASGKDEQYGCIFGRDSAITILKILKIIEKNQVDIDRTRMLGICRRTLMTLVTIQGKEVNVESGEEPGKFAHEYRKDKHEHLTKRPNPWFLYPDGTMKNYDSLDATPQF